MTLTAITNVYREPHALPGWLAMACGGFFDDVVVVSSPPASAPPDEETIEIAKQAGVRIAYTTIDDGYGIVRTRCIRECKTDWLLLMDADERFYPVSPQMHCEGSEKYPEVKKPKLGVTRGEQVNQGQALKDKLTHAGGAMALRMSRRHWFGPPEEMTSPCQNWTQIPDWQLRCIRNSPFVFFDPERKMHEHLKYAPTWEEPQWVTGDEHQGPFFDHFHPYFKGLDPKGREMAVQTYNKLDAPGTADMWSVKGYDDKP
jgi:hypothetical protein